MSNKHWTKVQNALAAASSFNQGKKNRGEDNEDDMNEATSRGLHQKKPPKNRQSTGEAQPLTPNSHGSPVCNQYSTPVTTRTSQLSPPPSSRTSYNSFQSTRTSSSIGSSIQQMPPYAAQHAASCYWTGNPYQGYARQDPFTDSSQQPSLTPQSSWSQDPPNQHHNSDFSRATSYPAFGGLLPQSVPSNTFQNSSVNAHSSQPYQYPDPSFLSYQDQPPWSPQLPSQQQVVDFPPPRSQNVLETELQQEPQSFLQPPENSSGGHHDNRAYQTPNPQYSDPMPWQCFEVCPHGHPWGYALIVSNAAEGHESSTSIPPDRTSSCVCTGIRVALIASIGKVRKRG
ncbi:hypothetical protein BJ546DRAFT_1060993 [Cryomyces antarcticus]